MNPIPISFIGLFFSLLLLHIQPQLPMDYQTYIIRQGTHRSVNSFEFVNSTQFRFEVIFDSSAVYKTRNPENQADINKLYGFSDCFSSHQENSTRFGWRWYQNRLELHAYCYKNGERISEFITAIDLHRAYICEINLSEQKYIFKLNGVTREVPRTCAGNGLGYKLYPYFGGDETAPHDIIIKIRDL
ncbi:MAG: hypothetical protein NW226_26365 [Microscillaceae bacterium]|nr:hypothetical protein [Microscillaceae bacterium]